MKFCFVTDNKEVFLNWVRAENWSTFLLSQGIKKLVLKGLTRWGNSLDQLLIDHLHAATPMNKSEIDWNLGVTGYEPAR